MSTAKVINIIHPSGSTTNLVNDNLGNVTIGNNLTVTGSTTLGTSLVVPSVIGGTTASSTLTLESTSGAGTTDSILFKTGSQSTRMTIDTSGNVGIGTTSPTRLLTVGDGTGGKYAEIKGGNSGTSGGSSLLLTLSSTVSYALGNYSSILGGAYDNTLLVYNGIASATAFYTSNTEAMRIDASGNVGIGTSSPVSKLTVAGSMNIGSGNFLAFSASAPSGSNFVLYGDTFGTVLNGPASGFTGFNINNTEQMRITSSGNVGIGTNSPGSNKLRVSLSDTSYNDGIYVQNIATGAGAWGRIGFSAGAYYGFIGLDNSGNYYLQNTNNTATVFATNNNERMRIDASGNLGFGTTSVGGGAVVIAIANATTVPTSNPSGGGILYVQGGALKYRGSSGTITTIAVA